jgi:hypothetical protein
VIETGFYISGLEAGFALALFAGLAAGVCLAAWAVFVRLVEA